VHNKQPTTNLISKPENKDVSTSETVCIGDFCVFTHHDLPSNQIWKIGKILQFSQYKEKLKDKH